MKKYIVSELPNGKFLLEKPNGFEEFDTKIDLETYLDKINTRYDIMVIYKP